MQSLFQLTVTHLRRTRLARAQRRELKGFFDLTISVVKWIAGTRHIDEACTSPPITPK
jgi:hypothetical protein